MFLEQPEPMAVDGAGLAAMMRAACCRKWRWCWRRSSRVMVAAGLAGHVLQSRPSLSFDKIVPDFSKVSPMAGFKRMFGAEGWMNLVKGLVKIAIVGVAIWTQLWPERGRLEAILSQSAGAVVGDMTHLLFKVLMAALSALAVIAGAGLFLAAHALHVAQPHVQAGDQGRVSPE